MELDLRPLDQQVKEYEEQEALKKEAADARGALRTLGSKITDRNKTLQTVVEEDESNYMSPATSFDASKKSSKQSLTGVEQMVMSTPKTIDEDPESLLPTPESSKHEFIFDADVFDNKQSASPVPTLDETTGAPTLDDKTTESTALGEGSNNKSTSSSAETEKRGSTSKKTPFHSGKFHARVQGKDITTYTPPALPKLPRDDKKSKFSFWETTSVKQQTHVEKATTKFSQGEKVSTPYGIGVVVEHRQQTKIVVVDMSGPWSARAYLQETIVRREGAGFLGTILRQFSTAQASPQRRASRDKERQFPHITGTAIYSPYGEGTVIRPLPLAKEKQPFLTPSPKATKETPESTTVPNTIAIGLESWTLRDGRHPTLYCTVDNAEKWRSKSLAATTPGHNRESSILSVIGSLVSGTVESLKKIRVPREIETPFKIETHKFERYYKDGAAVTTAYGDGTVLSFRESDGFYVVSLLSKSGKVFGTAYLREDSMSYRLARGCIEGYPVMTTFGSGVLQSVNPTTGVHNVIIPSFGAICYLQPDQVLRPLKAAVGEDVSTPYGEGKVYRYRLADNKYEIKLGWGNNAMLYAKAETFDRIDDRLEDKGGFNMGFILKFFYSREDGKDEEDGTQRSRSNSFSMLSQSGVSMKSLR